ncbi:MAG: cytochrome c [Brevundimonas sp.]|uniref:c-type cytochrome n=1 Tax=Brevundimonas sp. TaxID=1871086 RepID=UPI0027327B67|nr:cytochrome c [Brevundimonas sp.]MDP3404184.1 cytochrome c [Brevundimonas sp.]
MSSPRFVAALLFISAVAAGCSHPPPGVEAARAPAAAAAPDELRQAVLRGQQITAGTCASCHAIGPVGDSPMTAATPLREIARRYPLDQLEEAFAEGLVTGHPAMPEFVFRAAEIDDLMAYLQTLKSTS